MKHQKNEFKTVNTVNNARKTFKNCETITKAIQNIKKQ